MEVEKLPPIKDIISAYNLIPKKSLGQNFLLDFNLTLKIARAAGDLSCTPVLEIGPGAGSLTRALLLSGAQKIIALEQDERCVKALEFLVEASHGCLTVHQADASRVSLDTLGYNSFKIVANLPYNIASSLLISWLRQAEYISCMVLMFQKEVAERITASPGSKAYGRLSIIAQARAKCRKLFDIPPSAFMPAPKVTSSIIEIIPYPPSKICWVFEELEEVTQAAFSQRRKMLRSSLKPLFSNPETTLLSLGVDPQKRAEDLTVKEFIQLSSLIGK